MMKKDDGLDGDDETFRQEFLGQMSDLLGFVAPRSNAEPTTLNPLAEANLVRDEIARLKSLVDRYRAFVVEVTGDQKGKGRRP